MAPGFACRRAAGQEARRRMAPGGQTGAGAAEESTPEGNPRKAPGGSPRPLGIRPGDKALKRTRNGGGAPARELQEGRDRATGTHPVGVNALKGSPPVAAGGEILRTGRIRQPSAARRAWMTVHVERSRWCAGRPAPSTGGHEPQESRRRWTLPARRLWVQTRKTGRRPGSCRPDERSGLARNRGGCSIEDFESGPRERAGRDPGTPHSPNPPGYRADVRRGVRGTGIRGSPRMIPKL
jgi:hypothetical protein